MIGTLFAYGGTLIVGVPAFLLSRAHNNTGLWVAAAIGFGSAALTWTCFLVLLPISLGEGIAFARHELATNWSIWASFPPIGILGSIVGITLWLIARPDRKGDLK
jgi:hypothetical protein